MPFSSGAVWRAVLGDVEVLGLATRDGEGLPAGARPMLREIHDLPHVRRIMSQLTVDSLEHRVRLATHEHRFRQVLGREPRERVEQEPPARLPALEDSLARVGRLHEELGVAVPVRLVAVRREERRPARAHVAGDVLDDDRDAVRLGIRRAEKGVVGHLRHRPLGLSLELDELTPHVVEVVRSAHVSTSRVQGESVRHSVHASIWPHTHSILEKQDASLGMSRRIGKIAGYQNIEITVLVKISHFRPGGSVAQLAMIVSAVPIAGIYFPDANRRADSASVRGRVPDAAARQNGAAKRLGGSRPARATRLHGQLARRAAGDHGAERRAVLAARGGHAQRGRPGRHLRRPEVLHDAGGTRPRGERRPARGHQCRHGLRGAPQQHPPRHPPVGPRLSLRLPVDRSGWTGAHPDGRVRGGGPDGRAARLLRPARRLDQRTAAGHHLKPPARDVPDLRLAGGDVLLHDGIWRVVRGDGTVRDGTIQAVGRTDGRADQDGTPVSVRDCRGCLVIPGLVQAHVHLCQTLFRGLADDLRLEDWLVRRIWPLEAAHTEETVYASALLGAAELLLGGTTAILDMETVRHTDAAFRALERIGIRATVGKCLMDTHPEGAPVDLAESTDDALTDAAALAQRWHRAAEGRLRACFAPRFVPSCSGPLLRAASDLADRFDAQLHTHAAETIAERETVLRTTGLEEIAYLDSVGIAGRRAAPAPRAR